MSVLLSPWQGVAGIWWAVARLDPGPQHGADQLRGLPLGGRMRGQQGTPNLSSGSSSAPGH